MNNSSEVNRLRSQAIINGNGPTAFPRRYRCVRISNVRDRLKDACDDCKREFDGMLAVISAFRLNSAHVQLAEIDRYLQEEQP